MRRLAPPGSGRRQVGLLLAALALCPLAALLIGDDPAAPVARARTLIELERALGVHVEPAAVAWARGHGTLLDLAGAFYLAAHVGVAGWGARVDLVPTPRPLRHPARHVPVDAVAAVAVAAVARGLAAGRPQRAVGRARQARPPRRASAPPGGTVAGMPAARRP